MLPPTVFDRLTDLRVRSPELIAQAAAARRRRPHLAPDGRLVILACDHPGRHVFRVGDDPLGMGDRRAYLERIVHVLVHPGIDGVMTTPDIMDDLFLLDHMMKQAGGAGLLDGKVLMGCLNRGGLAGAAWELDDFLTAYTPARLSAMRLDAAKMMFRLDLATRDAAKAVRDCAAWITALNALGVPSFLEALPVRHDGTAWRMVAEADDLVRVVGVANAVGDSSALVWLKLPFAAQYERVARATTLPILLLGGESHGDPRRLLDQVAQAMAAGSNVRGVLIGRNVLFPGAQDPRAVAGAVADVVRGASVADAAARIDATAGEDIAALRTLLG